MLVPKASIAVYKPVLGCENWLTAQDFTDCARWTTCIALVPRLAAQIITAHLPAGRLQDVCASSVHVDTRFANRIVIELGLLNGTASASLVPPGSEDEAVISSIEFSFILLL